MCSRSLIFATALLLSAPAATADVYMSKKEGLASAFPDADGIERDTFLLTDAQVTTVEKLAGSAPSSRIVTFHRGMRGGEVQGFAFVDIHEVRTLPEALMVVLTPTGEIRMVRLLAFHEPEEYKAPDRWLEQFEGKSLSPGLRLKREIHGITGATLTSVAVTRSVRRALALYRILLRPGNEE